MDELHELFATVDASHGSRLCSLKTYCYTRWLAIINCSRKIVDASLALTLVKVKTKTVFRFGLKVMDMC